MKDFIALCLLLSVSVHNVISIIKNTFFNCLYYLIILLCYNLINCLLLLLINVCWYLQFFYRITLFNLLYLSIVLHKWLSLYNIFVHFWPRVTLYVSCANVSLLHSPILFQYIETNCSFLFKKRKKGRKEKIYYYKLRTFINLSYFLLTILQFSFIIIPRKKVVLKSNFHSGIFHRQLICQLFHNHLP